jgi:heat shock protein HslJ
MPVTSLMIAIVAWHPGIGRAQGKAAAWLDQAKPASWNKPGQPIPAAPKIQGAVDPRCKQAARPAQLDEDTRVQGQGWDLVGPYHGGWQVLVIRGTAGYDGMCRPRQYQDFVFVRGVFAGTLSPHAMDSRTDGALSRVSLQSGSHLIAEYERYSAADPLCCPSRKTNVVFDVATDGPVLRPVSSSTSQVARTPSPDAGGTRPFEGTYWRAIELAGKTTPMQDPKREAHLQFQTGGRLSGSDGCNRLAGTYELNDDRVTFGQMAGTQMACLNPSGTEAPFRDALKSATRLTVAGDRLELFDATGTRLAAFVGGSQASSPSSGLAGTSWQLVKFQGSDDTTLTPDDRAKYIIEFAADGRLAARIDCNRGRGTWKSSRANQIAFGPLALTRAKCPPGSLHDQIVKQWGNIRSYVIRDGHLFLALMADGGIYEFEPVAKFRE